MKIQLRDKQNLIIVSDLDISCAKCIKSTDVLTKLVYCPLTGENKRVGLKSSDFGTCFACTSSKDLIKSKKTFKRKLELSFLTLESISNSNEKLNENTRKFIHNLTKTNAHNIQELYALVPQDSLTKKLNEQIEIIERIILQDPKEAARTFLRIAKNNASMKIEFSIFNKLMGGKSALNIKRYNIKRATLNIFHIFFNAFKRKDVYVNVQDTNDHIYLDYDTLHVIFYHIIDNATKYILENTELKVEFKENYLKRYYSVFFDMISTKIRDDEKYNILDDKIRGYYAEKSQNPGQGIGLGRVVKILDVIEGELIIHNNVNRTKSVNKQGIKYEHNIFEIRFTNYATEPK